MKKLLLTFMAVCISAAMFAQTGDYFVDASRDDDSGAGTSWATARKTFTQVNALSNPTSFKNVFVAQGTYTKQFTGSTKRLNFYGGFPAGGGDFSARNWKIYPTIIDGNYPTNISASTLSFSTYPIIFDGFIVQNCYATTSEKGSGIKISNDGTVSNCIIRGCVSDPSNGNGASAVLLVASSSKIPKLINCEIYGNYTVSTGMYRTYNGNSVNILDGGTVQNCKIYNNSNLFTDPNSGNLGGDGAIYIRNNTVEPLMNDVNVINNVVFNNSAKNCSGIFISLNQTVDYTTKKINIVNNTFANNKAITGNEGFLKVSLSDIALDAAVNTSPDKININNNIFWGNKDVAVATVPTASIAKTTFTYNAIEGSISGLNASNISLSATNETNVKFTLPSITTGCSITKSVIDNLISADENSATIQATNWSISGTSACVNAGSTAALTATGITVTTDFAGNDRIFGTTSIDIGAYETSGTTAVETTKKNEFQLISVAGGIQLDAVSAQVFNFSGQQIWKGNVKGQFIALPAGNYIVKATTANAVQNIGKVSVK
ncbi:MAG: hypothetical protein GZ091_09420 [Paludibacter sp.]|nr:hypothetical protein [Paludibacter sp.]